MRILYSILSLFFCWSVLAEPIGPGATDVGASVSAAPGPVPTTYGKGSLNDIGAVWLRAMSGIRENDLRAVNDAVFEVERLRSHAGFRSADDYSMLLVRAAEAALKKGHLDEAAFYTRSALKLSPNSPRILLDSAPMVYYTGVGSGFGSVWSAITHLPSSPVLCLALFTKSIYPTLLAATLAVYLILVLYIVFWISDLLRGIAGYFLPYLRGIATPIAAFVLLAAPLSFGPLVCIVTWSLILWISDRRRKWPCYMAGVLLVAWCVVAPVREKLLVWSDVPATRVIFNVSSGNLGEIDSFELEKHVGLTPDDGAAWFVLGQLKRKSGDFAGALGALARASKLVGDPTAVAIESAVVHALLGDLTKARAMLDEAGKAGASSAEYYFNRSKIEMAQLDTAAARASMFEVERMDPGLAQTLKAREEELGTDSAVTYADARLGMVELVSTFWRTEVTQGDLAIGALLPGFSGMAVGIIGLVLLVLGSIPSATRKSRRVSPYYAEYVPNNIAMTIMRLLPGGPWIIEGKPFRALLLLTLTLLLAMPMAAWPADVRSLFEQLPSIATAYAIMFSIILVGLISWGLVRGER